MDFDTVETSSPPLRSEAPPLPDCDVVSKRASCPDVRWTHSCSQDGASENWLFASLSSELQASAVMQSEAVSSVAGSDYAPESDPAEHNEWCVVLNLSMVAVT